MDGLRGNGICRQWLGRLLIRWRIRRWWQFWRFAWLLRGVYRVCFFFSVFCLCFDYPFTMASQSSTSLRSPCPTSLKIYTKLSNILPTLVWLATIILGRDIALAISAIYWRWISLPPPKTFSRYWDFSLPSAEVHPTTISKYNTALQIGLIGTTTALPLISWDIGVAMTGFQWVVFVCFSYALCLCFHLMVGCKSWEGDS